MKILQVVSFLSPRRGGGVVSVVHQLSRALTHRGHEVVIYTSDFEHDASYIRTLDGVRVELFPSYLTLNQRPLFMQGLVGKARKEIASFDIVHMHGYRGYIYTVTHHLARRHRVPYLVDAHSADVRVSKGKLRWLADRFWGYRVLKDATEVIAETMVGQAEYQSLGISSERINILYPPFTTEDYACLPPPGGLRQKYHLDGKRIVLFMGRIDRIKGIDFLVESFIELSRRRSDVVLVIAGADDGFQGKLEKIIESSGRPQAIIFAGYLQGDAKKAALIDADLLAQPSLYEQGLNQPCLEATLCGVPFIVTKGTGAAEIAQKMNAGYMVEYGNSDDLNRMIEYILDNRQETAPNITRARDYILRELSMTNRVTEYEKIYSRCIADKATNRARVQER